MVNVGCYLDRFHKYWRDQPRLWACPGGIVWTKLIEVGRPTLNVVPCHKLRPWTKEKTVSWEHAFIVLASQLWMKCRQLSPTSAAILPRLLFINWNWDPEHILLSLSCFNETSNWCRHQFRFLLYFIQTLIWLSEPYSFCVCTGGGEEYGCMGACGSWRFRTSVTSMALHLNCGDRATHWTQSSLTSLVGLTSKPQGSPYLCVSSTWIINAYCHDLAFTWVLKIQIQVLKLVGQTLSQWNNLPSSYMSFYTHEINFTSLILFISILHT